MIDFLRSAGAIALVFGLVIFIHELGHFLAAKAFRVYAPRFSIGFGPALWSRKWGETEYVLAAVPLGGYVRMASRDDETMAFIEGGKEEPAAEPSVRRPRFWREDGLAPFGPRPVPADRWFESKPIAARLVILVAGVTMNLVLGFAIYTGLAVALGRPLLLTRVVGAVAPVAALPQLPLALSVGDTILAVGGVPIATWNDVVASLDSAPGDTVVLHTQRAELRLAAGAPGGTARRTLIAAISPMTPPVVDKVVAGTPAQRAGIHAGDSVVAVDGTPVRSWRELVALIEPAAGRALRLELVRETARLTVTVRPDSARQMDAESHQLIVVGKIGAFARVPQRREAVPFASAVSEGAQDVWLAAGLVARSLRMLVTGEVSVRQLNGPVAIGGLAVEAARRGWESLLNLLALISINVAVFNLLPIPVLDGGQVLFLVAEGVKGSAVSLRTREYLMRAGIALILLLLIVVMINDVPALVRSLRGP